MDFKLGFLGKNKDKHDAKQADEVKQATISNLQPNTPSSRETQMLNTTQNPNQTEQNFVNPFSNPETTQTQNLNEFSTNNDAQFTPSFAQEHPNSNTGTQTQTNENQEGFINPFQNQADPSIYANQSGIMQGSENGQTNLSQHEMNANTQEQTNPTTNLQTDPLITMNETQNMNKDQMIEMIDETVEKIIDEKWNELVNSVNKIGKWKEKTESVIEMMKEDIVAMRDGFEKLEGKIVNKINSYDKDLMDVSGEIKALEKVFQKITPTLINNVNELSKIADEFKGIKPKNKNTPGNQTLEEESIPQEKESTTQ